MSFKEQCEALEEAGIDPDEHHFLTMSGSSIRAAPVFGTVSLNFETLLLHAAGHYVVAGAALFGNGCEETVAARKVKAVKTTLR